MADKNKTPDVDIDRDDDDTPEYQDMILFYLSNGVKTLVLVWSLSILSLAYISFPPVIKIGNIEFEMPDQRPDTSFASAMLGTVLTSYGLNVSKGASSKKKNGDNGGGGQQTLIIKQPIEIITRKPEVIRVDPITGKNITNEGKLG
tara:strand:- start:2015 stop:2452 length:438 start_codon:yes stop_codon:yes gene_type:complete